jgi:hypothetical protein
MPEITWGNERSRTKKLEGIVFNKETGKIMDHGWVTGGRLLSKINLSNSQTHLPRLLYWIWNSKFRVQSHELQMLPCWSPCARSRLTHQLLEKLNSRIAIFLKYPHHQGDFREVGFGTWQSGQGSSSEFLVEQPDLKGTDRRFLNPVFV